MATTGTARAGQPGESIDSLLTYAFAPVHKLALGLAFGLTAGTIFAGLTILHLSVLGPRGPHIGLLSQYFYGYDVSWSGAAIGFFWAFVMAFVAGWFIGFLKNLITAVWMFRVRTKAQLSQPFLDHI